MRVAYRIIHGIDLARITKEGKELLHFSPNTRVGYWFLFEEHTVLRIYEFEGEPYKFHTFITMRFVIMEYVRKIPMSNEIHFKNFRQHKTFHLPREVGPFQVKSLNSLQYIEGFL